MSRPGNPLETLQGIRQGCKILANNLKLFHYGIHCYSSDSHYPIVSRTKLFLPNWTSLTDLTNSAAQINSQIASRNRANPIEFTLNCNSWNIYFGTKFLWIYFDDQACWCVSFDRLSNFDVPSRTQERIQFSELSWSNLPVHIEIFGTWSSWSENWKHSISCRSISVMQNYVDLCRSMKIDLWFVKRIWSSIELFQLDFQCPKRNVFNEAISPWTWPSLSD